MNKRLQLTLLLLVALAIPVAQADEIPAADLAAEFVNFPYDHNVLPLEFQNAIRDPKADLKKIAASLIERKKQFVLRWDDPAKMERDFFPESMEDCELLCFIPEQYIDSVLAKGQKNVHQVGHSRGLCEKVVRSKAEDFMIGIHLEGAYDDKADSPVHALRPKYGFVNFPNRCGVKMNPFRLFQYGQVIVVYRDQVKHRTTYTFGDSLASYCEPMAVTLRPLDPMPLSIMKPPSEKEKTCRYVEAQIWGPIDASDIKEIRVPAERKDLAQKLANCGVPVYSYDRTKIEETDCYTDVSECGWQRGEALNQLAVDQVQKEKLAQH